MNSEPGGDALRRQLAPHGVEVVRVLPDRVLDRITAATLRPYFPR